MPGYGPHPMMMMPPRPYLAQHNAQADMVRVRIGAMEDAPRQSEAYVLVGLDGMEKPRASRPLPHGSSALLPANMWQIFTFEIDPLTIQTAQVHMEVVGWYPGVGEKSLGKMSTPVIQALRAGRVEVTAPQGLVIEVDYLPRMRDMEHVLPGSGVLRVANPAGSRLPSQLYDGPSFGPSYGYDGYGWPLLGGGYGYEPSPSFAVSVGGLPPSVPPEGGGRWVWGIDQWHAVRDDRVVDRDDDGLDEPPGAHDPMLRSSPAAARTRERPYLAQTVAPGGWDRGWARGYDGLASPYQYADEGYDQAYGALRPRSPYARMMTPQRRKYESGWEPM